MYRNFNGIKQKLRKIISYRVWYLSTKSIADWINSNDKYDWHENNGLLHHSPPILELRTNNLPSFLVSFLLNKFLIHKRDHLIRLGIGHPPSPLCTFRSFLCTLAFILAFLLSFHVDVAMYPVDLVLFALVWIGLFVWLSFWRWGLLEGAWASSQLSVLFFEQVYLRL